MRTTRHLREYLTERFPAWQVTDETREITVTRPTIAMAPNQIDRIETAGRTLSIAVQVDLWILTEKHAPREIEAELDKNVVKLLAALEADPRFTWSNARRGALETGHGWNISVTYVLQTEPL